MSVTKLKTVGNWQAQWKRKVIAAPRTNVRGRVITGLLTGGDTSSEAPPVAPDQRTERTR